jgi:glycosyltransferase involved in cell wall biosynthesis
VKNPSFGIIMTNYNDAKYLKVSLPAIFNQQRQLDELVIVDDGSTDDSVEIIESYQKQYGFIKLLRNEHNLGVIPSINRALNASTCDYVNWAASDDKILPEFVSVSAKLMEKYPHSAICASELATFKEDSDELRPKKQDALAFDFSGCPEYISPRDVRRWHDSHILWISGNTTFLRREVLVGLGGYEKGLEWHADWFIGVVLSLRYGICIIPKVLAGLREKPDSYSQKGLKSFQQTRIVIWNTIDLMRRSEYNDIYQAVCRHPCLLSPLDSEKIRKALVRSPKYWLLLTRYVNWEISYVANLEDKTFLQAAIERIPALVINKIMPGRFKSQHL